jgi:hypothetical protein
MLPEVSKDDTMVIKRGKRIGIAVGDGVCVVAEIDHHPRRGNVDKRV